MFEIITFILLGLLLVVALGIFVLLVMAYASQIAYIDPLQEEEKE